MTAQEKLLEQYDNALKRLLRRIKSLEARGSWAGVERRMVAEIRKAVQQLDKAAAANMSAVARNGWRQGVRGAESALRMSVPLGGGLNTAMMNYIAANAVDSMIQANHYFGRHWEDEARKIGLETVSQKSATAQTVKQAAAAMVHRMEAEGWTSFIDKGGRKWPLDTYAKLVARTTTREASNTSTIETCRAADSDLVLITVIPNATCAVCAAVQGRVFSISGKDKRFPGLFDLPGFRDGFKTLHPNCRHNVTPTVEKFWTEKEREQYLADGQKPIDIDPRSAKEVEMYNRIQRENRERAADRRQYAQYKAALGDDAPKSFSGFRAMKRAGSENWQALREKYRAASQQLTPSEEAALTRYVSFEAYPLNEKLRAGTALDSDDLAFVRALDGALKKLPKYEGVVNRSLYDSEELRVFLSGVKVDKEESFPAYTSASNGLYDTDDSVRMVIRSKTGRDASAFNKPEAEVIFARGTIFKYTNMWYDETGKFYLEMEEVPVK